MTDEQLKAILNETVVPPHKNIQAALLAQLILEIRGLRKDLNK
jgi:hypothetical protein